MSRAVGLLLLASSSTQFGAAFAVSLFDRLGPGGTVLLRLALAALVLLVIWRPRVAGRSRADLGLTLCLGIALGLMNWSYYQALDRIPLGATVTIEFLGPMSVALWGSRRPRDVLWVLLAATGVVLLADPFGGGGGLDPLGVLLALGAGVGWATYIVFTARVGRVWPGASGLAVAMVVGAFVAVPAGIVQGGSQLLVPGLLAAGLGVALASSVIPYSLEMHALRLLPTHVFGVLMSLEPAIAALAGLVVLGQGLAGRDVVAIGCVTVASAGATLGARSLQGAMAPVLVATSSNRSG